MMLILSGEFYRLNGEKIQLTKMPHKWWVKYLFFINYNPYYVFEAVDNRLRKFIFSEVALVHIIKSKELKHCVI